MPGQLMPSRQMLTLLRLHSSEYGFVLLFCTFSNPGVGHTGRSRIGIHVPVWFDIWGKHSIRCGSSRPSIPLPPSECGNSENRTPAAGSFAFFSFSQPLPFSSASRLLFIKSSTVLPNTLLTLYRIIADGFVFFPFSRNRMYRSVVPDSSANRDWESFCFFRSVFSLSWSNFTSMFSPPFRI